MRGKKTPSKKELARIKAMNDLGESPTSIANRMGRSHNTVIKYLASDVYNNLKSFLLRSMIVIS